MSKRELDQPGPATSHELKSRGLDLSRRPLDAQHLQELFDHQRWLLSDNRFGNRLVIWKQHEDRKNFVNYDLDGADFSKSILEDVFFVNCSLRGARFNGATLASLVFLGCDVDGADFRGTRLSHNTQFEETNYRKAQFDPHTKQAQGIKVPARYRSVAQRRLLSPKI